MAVEMGYQSIATGALIAWEFLQREHHIYTAFKAEHYRPDDHSGHVHVVNPKTNEGDWTPLFNKRGAPLYPELMAELDAMKALRPTGGLMLRRDASGLPWATKGEMLTHFARVVKTIIRATGLRDELTFTSFRHGGATEAATSGLSDSEMRVKGQWTSNKVLKNYVHKNDEMHINAHEKRRANRAKK
jgi:integrase